MLQIGGKLSKYTIVRKLGQGEFGEVYEGASFFWMSQPSDHVMCGNARCGFGAQGAGQWRSHTHVGRPTVIFG